MLVSDFPSIKRESFDTIQVNLGYRCNQSCTHCHVNAGPTRTEMMSAEIITQLIGVLERHRPTVLDLTGGAPELHPHFKNIVTTARALGVEVIDRYNRTVLLEPGLEDMAGFLAENKVQVTASLPCYQIDNVDAQRGKGVFDDSIKALQLLNSLGYGGELTLNLVYNPQGPQLPPAQQALEQEYRHALADNFGIRFTSLLTLTNMPISRFGAVLMAHDQYHSYMGLLRDNYDASNLDSVMCRSLISVDWQGRVYDCDFNQMLDLPLSDQNDVFTLTRLHESSPIGRKINVGEHCYACTAGQGSSCSGALVS